MRCAVVVLVSLGLGGCALPPPLSWASLALDGISLATTGKSTTDHMLSAIVGQDCVTLRVLQNQPLCGPAEEVTVVLSDVRMSGTRGAGVHGVAIRRAGGPTLERKAVTTVVCVPTAGFCARVEGRSGDTAW